MHDIYILELYEIRLAVTQPTSTLLAGAAMAHDLTVWGLGPKDNWTKEKDVMIKHGDKPTRRLPATAARPLAPALPQINSGSLYYFNVNLQLSRRLHWSNRVSGRGRCGVVRGVLPMLGCRSRLRNRPRACVSLERDAS